MLMERPLALATTGISLALMIPECNALMEQPNQFPGAVLIAGVLIGAVGIYVGSTTASSYYKALGRAIRLTVWGLLGLGMSIVTVYFGLRVTEYWQKALFLGTGCLPLLAYLGIVFRNR
jgi:membrane protease YdiL (CAAX protease family)